jgi:hypothetical protein
MNYASLLRREISERSVAFAQRENNLHAISDGAFPTVIFGHDEQDRHGNFHPASYRRIQANACWAARLSKVHTSSRRMMVRSDWRWRELDCAASSDALLMNIFCHPHTFRDGSVRSLLAVRCDAQPLFGFRPRVPLNGGRVDQTEVDMKLGDLLIEAKLTETGFQTASVLKIARYRDVEQVFGSIESFSQNVRGYQVMRGILAAFALQQRFCLMCDARRPDLIECWYAVLNQVRIADLRCRILLLTWQELASHLPDSLQKFLSMKYGIDKTSG